LGALLCRRIPSPDPGGIAAALPGTAADAPLLDPAIATVVMAGDRQGMAELFASTADMLRADILHHAAEGNAEPLAEAAHSLASAALSLGATRLGLTARSLEHAARSGEWAVIPALAEQVAALDDQTRLVLTREWERR
jgi:HPt (histidine-containing phosphotransfer) domain-containing protein